MMKKEEIAQLFDECFDQQKFAQGLAAKSVVPWLEEVKAKIMSKEIDLIKGTEVDNVFAMSIIDQLLMKAKGL